jgi:hypothetical protein
VLPFFIGGKRPGGLSRVKEDVNDDQILVFIESCGGWHPLSGYNFITNGK